VQPLSQIPDALDEVPFDERVHVFIGAGDKLRFPSCALQNIPESGRHHFGVGRAEHARPCESLHPREAPGYIVLQQPLVEPEG
jgi:hypothetical protein